MNRYFEIGQELSFGEKNGIYVIREVIGRGSSCVVYLADHTNKSGNVTEHILKEYNPKRLNIIRDALGYLIAMNEADSKVFSEGLERFATGMQKQLELHRCDELKNYTSNIQSSYYENGTLYIDMTVTNGTAYQHVEEKSLYDLMRRMKVFTHVIGAYHSKGYLHLDIKPENIYVRPDNETCEDVLLFDFDSITAKSDIANAMLSYTQQWAAMEQLLPNRRNRICESTDLFAIGEIIFYKLTGRHSENTERSMLTEISFDYSSQIFENVNPKVIPLLNELFRKTLCDSVNKRYQSADELEAQLEKIISLSDPQKPYLKSTLPSRPAFFVGREKEVAELHKLLSKNNIVYICGIGGIGKSELVKYYANKYINSYDTIVFAHYVNSMITLITNDNTIPIVNFFCFPDEKVSEYYKRKINKLKELCSENTLLIIDNLNDCDLSDDELNCFLTIKNLKCKILITTRCREWDGAIYELGEILQEKDREKLFFNYCNYDDSYQEYVEKIIEYTHGHTLSIELIAKQIKKSFETPKIMYEKILSGGIKASGKEKVALEKDDNLIKSNAYSHIVDLFDISQLSDFEKIVLYNMSLIPPDGIETGLFVEWCEIEDKDIINSLLESGWLNFDKNKLIMHPIVSEVVFEEMSTSNYKDLCSKLLLSIERLLKDNSIDNNKNCVSHITRYLLKRLRLTSEIEIEFVLSALSFFLHQAEYNTIINYICQESIEKRDILLKYSAFEYLNICAQVYKEIGNYSEAVRLFKEAISTVPQNDVYLNVKLINPYNSLGFLYHEMGRDDLARHCFEEAQTIYRRAIPDIANTYIGIGQLKDMEGNHIEALQYLESALSICNNVYLSANPVTAYAYCSIGEIYRRLKSFDKAKENFLKGEELRKKCYGEIHPEVAKAYNNLGLVYKDSMEWNKALFQFEKSLSVVQKLLAINQNCDKEVIDENHPLIAELYNNIGEVYLQIGRLDLAEKYRLKSQMIDKNLKELSR